MEAASYVILIVSSFAILFAFSSLLGQQRRRRKTPIIPFTFPVIGHLIPLLLNRNRFYDWVTDLLSEATPSKTIEVRPPFFATGGVCTAEPANVEHILRSNFPNYVKGPRFNAVLADFLGDGIFNADANLWAHQRKTASYEFNTRSLKSFIADTVEAEITGRLIPTLLAAAEAGRVVDLDAVFRRFALDNICNLAFGDDPACLGQALLPPFALAMDEAAEICFHRFLSPVPGIWKAKRVLNVGSERRLRRAVKTIDDYLMRIVASREDELSTSSTGTTTKPDLLSRFIQASHKDNQESGQKRRKFLRDVILSFVFAGKDSTSTALSWFFWLLSENPRCETRILEEIREVVSTPTDGGAGKDGEEVSVDGIKIPGYEEMKRMNYLHAAISESLRLYPPVPHNSRQAAADDVLPDGSRVGRGLFADYSAYAMGRMESLWGPDCREFRPERWLREGAFVPVDQFRFPVFHGGPRLCLGKDMAYLQMKAVAASVLSLLQVVKIGEERPGYTVSLTPKMKGGLHVRLLKRKLSAS